jgi:hypothetical protein
MERKIYLPALIVFMVLSIGCAGALVKKDVMPKERYLAALTEFNDTVEDYLEEYKLQTPTIQADWKREIDPWIKKASAALDAWGSAVDENTPVEEKIKKFKNLRAIFIATLVAEGIIKIDE